MNKKLVSIILTIALCLGLLPTGVYAEENATTENVTQQQTENNAQIPKENDVQTPSDDSTQSPSDEGTQSPSDEGTQSPSDEGTQSPSDEGTQSPSDEGTQSPSDEGTQSPSDEGTQSPSDEGTQSPSDDSTQSPSDEGTQSPSDDSTQSPSDEGTQSPSDEDTQTTPDNNNTQNVPSGITTITNNIKAKAKAVTSENEASVTIDGNTTYYTHISEAFGAVGKGDTATITLLKNADISNMPVLTPSNSTITFEGGDYSLSRTDGDIPTVSVFGTFILQNGTIDNGIAVADGGKVIINNGSILSSSNGSSLYIEKGAEAEINGGTIDKLSISYDASKVVLSGGTYTRGISLDKASPEKWQSLLAKGYQYFQADGKTAFTNFGDKGTDEKIIVAEECQHQFDEEGTCTKCGLTSVATVTVGDKTDYYSDIAKAFEQANGKTATVHILRGDNNTPEGFDLFDIDTYDLLPKIEITGGNITLTMENEMPLFRNIVVTGGTFKKEVNGQNEIEKITVDGGKAILNGLSVEDVEEIFENVTYLLEVKSGSVEINGGMFGCILAEGGTINITDGASAGMPEEIPPIAVSGDATVTVDDIAFIPAMLVKGGTVEYKNDYSSIDGSFKCSFKMDNGTVNISGGKAFIPDMAGGTVNISGGTAEIPDMAGGTVNISGGKARISDMGKDKADISKIGNGTVNITDGEITYLGVYDGKVTISGGNFEHVQFYLDFSNVEISGGTFNFIGTYASPNVTIKDFLKKGYAYYIDDEIVENVNIALLPNPDESITGTPIVVKECTHKYDDSDIHDSGDGTHGGTCKICGFSKSGEPHIDGDGDKHCDVCGIEFVVSVTEGSDTKYFAEFEQAWAVAKKASKATVTLLEYLPSQPKNLTVEDGNDITLSASFSTIYLDSAITVNGGAFTVAENVGIVNVIVNNGVLTVTDGYISNCEVNGGTVTMRDSIGIINGFTVNDGTVDIHNGFIDFFRANGGTITLSGGNFISISTEEDAQNRKVCDLLANGYAYRKAIFDGFEQPLQKKDWLTSEEYDSNLLVLSEEMSRYVVDEIPVKIVRQSPDTEVVYGNEMPALTVTTQPTDNVTYQWYSVDGEGTATLIPDATQNSYTPQDLEIGSYLYYCDVTFTDDDGYAYTLSGETITVKVVEKEIVKVLPKLTLTASPSQLNEGGTVTLTLAGLPQGETATVVCDDSSIVVTEGENNTYTVTLPDTAKTYTFTATYAGNEIYYPANASCTVFVNENSSIILPDTPEGNDGEKLEIIMEDGIKTVPEGLKDIEELNTPEKLETAMQTHITQVNTDINKENTAVYNVTLMVSTDGGNTWTPATKDNFPQNGGLTITLPYPEGTDSNYQFVVVHMFTTNDFGKVAGTTETPEVENTENGIRFTVTGLSPISVGWIAPQKPEQPDKPNTSTSKRSSGGGRTGSLKMYDIVVENSIGGKVTPNRTTAPSGSSVTLNVQPNDGYTLENITVIDDLAKNIDIDDKNTFYMPSSNVTVKATFTESAENITNDENVVTNDEKDCPSSAFADLQQNAWYHQAVDFVLENGLMNGYSNTEFAPNNNISRAQLAQILYNKQGRPEVNGNSVFTDVPKGEWYADAVNWAASEGIVNGYGNGIFAPNDNITREQLAVMLWQYAQKPNYNNKELTFHDVAQISDYASDALYWAVENGILNGYEDSTLRPKGLATRAQAAQMLKTFID